MNASWNEDGHDRRREREQADRSEETAEETVDLEDIDQARRQWDDTPPSFVCGFCGQRVSGDDAMHLNGRCTTGK